MRNGRSVAALALLLAATALPAQDKSGVTLDKEKRRLVIDAKVAPRKLEHLKGEIYPIEVIACWAHPKGKKAHETVVTIEALPSAVHKGLVELGLKPGTPVMGGTDEPKGPEVAIYLEVPSPDGPRKLSLDKVLLDKRTQKPFPKTVRWRFTGSVLSQPDPTKDEKVYGADLSGTLICIFPVSDQTVFQTNLTMEYEKFMKLETNTSALPPEGTAVKLVIEAPGGQLREAIVDRIARLLLAGPLLALVVGCGQLAIPAPPGEPAPRQEPPAQPKSGVVKDMSGTGSMKVDDPLADRASKLVQDFLSPLDPAPLRLEANRAKPKPLSGNPQLERPEQSLPPVPPLQPRTLARKETGNLGRSRTLPEELPLLPVAPDALVVTARQQPVIPFVAVPSFAKGEVMPLAPLARPLPDRETRSDVTGEASRAAALDGPIPQRTSPAPFQRLDLPNPFELSQSIRLRRPLDESPQLPDVPVRAQAK